MRQRTGREKFWKFTDEEMEAAKNTDLPDLLEHLGYHVKRSGSYYTTREMDSLMIKNRRTWKRYSNGKGGDAITFLQEFEGKGFREAVDYLLEFNGRARDAPTLSKPRPPPREDERPEFVLPPANPDNRRVFAYLRKRGIAPQVIRAFLNAGLLYEDEKYHNCVFVGRDGSGQPKFASKRGTYDKDGSSFKRDVLGSDKSVAFPIPCDPTMRMEGEPLGSFDFNKLLPMPKELNMEAGSRTDQGLKLVREYHQTLAELERRKPGLTPAEYALGLHRCEDKYREKRMTDPAVWALGEQAYSNIQRFGCPTWYEWCKRNWGTKWNAYGFPALGKDSDTMEFFTAWDSVPKIITLLSKKYPEQTITYRWADEDIGRNVGEMTLKGGEIIDINVPEGGSREAYELAGEIMDIDLSEYGLCPSADGSSHEYRQPDDVPGVDKGGLEPPPAPMEQAKAPKKKRGAKGQDR